MLYIFQPMKFIAANKILPSDYPDLDPGQGTVGVTRHSPRVTQ